MKKLLVCLAVLTLLLVPAMAMAGGTPPPCNELGEVDTWCKNSDGDWVLHTVGSSTPPAMARCWKTGEGTGGECNKATWSFEFTNHASMAQWSKWVISNTRWDWRILKPGTYAADCIELWVQSNGPININFAGFTDLMRPEDDADDPHGGDTLHNILTWYALVPFTPVQGQPGPGIADTENRWVEAAKLGTIEVEDSVALHGGLHWKLFNMLDVKTCNSVGEYENTGTISISLTNIKPWVDGVNGGWLSSGPEF